MSEFSPLWGGNEGDEACDDEEQEKALALLWCPGGFRGRGLTLFRNAQIMIDAVSRETEECPRCWDIFADAITKLGGI